MALAFSHGNMGTNQPVSVHPLFLREYKIQPTSTVSSGQDTSSEPEANTTFGPTPAPQVQNGIESVDNRQFNNILPQDVRTMGHDNPHGNSSNFAPIFPPISHHQFPEPHPNGSQSMAPFHLNHAPGGSYSNEEDLNAERRKRQKTDEIATLPEAEHGVPDAKSTTNTPPIFIQDATIVMPTFGLEQAEPSSLHDDHGCGFVNPPSVPTVPLDTTQGYMGYCSTPAVSADTTMTDGSGAPTPETDTIISDKPSTPKKKILKLNANGKLLSPSTSQVAPKEANVSRGRKGGLKKKTSGNSKIVIMKYTPGDGSLIAQRIAKILTAVKTPKPLPQKPSPKQESSAKATHPFFLGKPKPKPKPAVPTETPAPKLESGPTVSPGTNLMPAIFQPHTRTSTPDHHSTPGTTTFSRNPDAIPPIWPPHSFQSQISRQHESYEQSYYSYPRSTSKKSKQVAQDVAEHEGLLYQLSTNLSIKPPKDLDKSIRIPSRKLLSGRECLQIIDADRFISSSQREKWEFHPGIQKLRSTLTHTRPAFDQGKFDYLPWTAKYAPEKAEEILHLGRESKFLKDWIQSLTVYSVDDGSAKPRPRISTKPGRKKKRVKKTDDPLADFIVTTDDETDELNEIDGSEDELAGSGVSSLRRSAFRNASSNSRPGSHDPPKNAIIISGPHGCGKTAAVQAVAKELGFEIFEINSGSRRSAKDILDKVGDMTQNHLVQRRGSDVGSADEQPSLDQESVQAEVTSGRQATMNVFFKQTSSKPKPTKAQKPSQQQSTVSEQTHTRKSQKQSLILIEEVDVLFEEDRAFWNAITTLIATSRRPIIMTCSDESLVPLADLSLEAVLRLAGPPQDLASEYLATLAACEGHIITKDTASKLYQQKKFDLRASIMELNFWCQLAVGSSKAGLDWMINQKEESLVNDLAEQVRITSIGTYQNDMGFFPYQHLSPTNSVDDNSRENLMLFADTELGLQVPAWTPSLDAIVESNGSKQKHSNDMDDLTLLSQFADFASDLDLLYASDFGSGKSTVLDASHPNLSQKARTSYCEGYTLLETFELPDYSRTSSEMAASMISQLSRSVSQNPRSLISAHVLGQSASMSQSAVFSTLQNILQPLLSVAPPVFPPPTGRVALSIDVPSLLLATDIAPYTRHIIAYDRHLEEQRKELNLAFSGQETSTTGKRKARTTRASRAALEGGRKEDTRREKWFYGSVDEASLLKTGRQNWLDALTHMLNEQIRWAEEAEEDIDAEGEPDEEYLGYTLAGGPSFTV